MIEFNPDGSLKLPGHMQEAKDKEESRMKMGRCMRIERDVVSFVAPKACNLNITLSQHIKDDRFMDTIYQQWKKSAVVPSKINKLKEKEFCVEIGTDFRRCSDCQRLIGEYREFMMGNIIEKKGNCTFKGKSNFCYEDHFD